ncbi:MAG TPA: hypothetical protein DCQ36_00750, partial [Actinobacteria bacterium]|nr:hypothetical protein [Actinomycetota bacterium]
AADSDEAGMRARLDQLERRMASAPIHQAPAGQPPVGREQVSDVTAPEPAASASTSAPASVSASTSKSTRAKPPRLSDVAPSTAAEPAESPTAVPPAAASVEPAEAVVASVAASAPADPAPASAGGATYAPTLDQFVSLWPAVLEALKTYSKVAWLGFSSSRPISYANGDLAVAVRDAGTVKGVKASGHDERLRQAVIDVVRADVRIDVVFAPDQAGAVPSEPSPSATRSNEPASAAPTAGAPSTRAPAAGAPSTQAAAAVEPDAPSMDDDDLDDSSGVDLAMREFGATQIGEIEH